MVEQSVADSDAKENENEEEQPNMFGTAGQRKTYNSSNVQSFGPADSEAKLLRDSTNKF